MNRNKESLLALVNDGIRNAQGNVKLTAKQLAFAVAEHVNDEFKCDASGLYDRSTSEYSVIIPPTDDTPGYIFSWRFVRQDNDDGIIDYQQVMDVRQIDHAGNKSISKEYDVLCKALHADPAYAWSWQCNIAVPLMDKLGISHKEANDAAAHLLQHLFKLDITQLEEYKSLSYKEPEQPSPVAAKELDPRYRDPTVNHVYVTVEGFAEGSGGEDVARYIDAMVRTAGMQTLLNIPFADSVSAPVNMKNTLVSITGIEYRNEYGGTDYADGDFGAGDAFSDDGPDIETVTTGDSDYPPTEPRMVLKLKLDDHDTAPEVTINHFRQLYPQAEVEVEYKVEPYYTDHIHGEHRKALAEQARKTIHLTLDPTDPEPERTVSAIQSIVSKGTGKSLGPHNTVKQPATWEEEKPTLANPIYRKNAYIFAVPTADGAEIAVMHIDVDAPEFDVAPIYMGGVDILHGNDERLVRKLIIESIPATVDFIDDLVANNNRWLATYGNRDAFMASVKQVENKPFTLYNIPQGAIPKSIYALVESCWTDWQQTTRLEELGVEIGDLSVVIDFTDYLMQVKRGFMVVREHPRLEELFLKLLKKRAEYNSTLDMWLRVMGR